MRRSSALVLGVAVATIGAAAATYLIAGGMSTRDYVANIRDYRRTEDAATIIVTAELSELSEVLDVTTDEDSSSIRVTVIVRQRRGTAPSDILFVGVHVRLKEPLGNRTVKDSQGRPVQESRGP